MVSADCDGVIKLWDIRMVKEIFMFDIIPNNQSAQITSVAIDKNENFIMAACSDSTVKMYIDYYLYANIMYA